MDANQRWDVSEAIDYMKQLAKFKPIWIEEPTSPDDALGDFNSQDNQMYLFASVYQPNKTKMGEKSLILLIFCFSWSCLVL